MNQQLIKVTQKPTNSDANFKQRNAITNIKW